MRRRDLVKAGLLLAVARPALAGVGAKGAMPPPVEAELSAHPRCVVCNMDRRMFHETRHLVQFGDGAVEGTCSINCAAERMVAERLRGFAGVYAPDYGSALPLKPLVEAASATYLIGSQLRPVMSRVSKYAFADAAAASRVRASAGGEVGTFGAAFTACLNELSAGIIRRYESDRERARRAASAGA
ncbi:MAG: hypothetical protein H6R14_446 [Proteobacteria bacterium]|nr:hypothetical protein [Pseudomonadota bacterium]